MMYGGLFRAATRHNTSSLIKNQIQKLTLILLEPAEEGILFAHQVLRSRIISFLSFSLSLSLSLSTKEINSLRTTCKHVKSSKGPLSDRATACLVEVVKLI